MKTSGMKPVGEPEISAQQQRLVNDLMFRAISERNWERFNLCLDKGAKITAKDSYGRTPLMRVVELQMTEGYWLPYLLSQPQDFFVKNQNDRTVFDMALGLQDTGVKKKVLDALIEALPSVKANFESAAAPLKAEPRPPKPPNPPNPPKM
jgi:hypothetical protein